MYYGDISFSCITVISLTVSLAPSGQSTVPGSCSFTKNDTCGYQLDTDWSVNRGEYIFHRPVIVNGSGKVSFIYVYPN